MSRFAASFLLAFTLSKSWIILKLQSVNADANGMDIIRVYLNTITDGQFQIFL